MESIKNVVSRFPHEIGFALLGTIAATVLIEISDLNVPVGNFCVRLIMMANLGLVLSCSLSLFLENNSFSGLKRVLFRLLVLLLVIVLFFLIDPSERETDYFRFILLALAIHLLVSFSAFFGTGKIHAFWQFNKTIFLRFIVGGLYSAVLFLGLAAALGSMNFLFNFNFDWDTFAIVWVWIAGIFQTVFFLSGVPRELNKLEELQTYPNALKVFTQFVLVPLASVYAIILLAYEVKILIDWELPKGLVSNLVLGYAVFGILSLLLIYPVRNLSENKWLNTFSRSFYYVLIPLILLLFWAVLARVIDYGLTEERYFLIILAVWLSFICGYFLISKTQNIMIIPFSLCMVTICSVYGPQGAFSISKRSQIHELKLLFEKHGALEGDRIISLKVKPEKNDRVRMINIVDYLVVMHGLESFNPIIKHNLEQVKDSLNAIQESKKFDSRNNRWELISRQKLWLYQYLNLQADDENNSKLNLGVKTVEAFKSEPIPLDHPDYLLSVNLDSDTSSTTILGKKLLIYQSRKENKLSFEYNSEVNVVHLEPFLSTLEKEFKNQNLADKQTVQVPGYSLSQEIEFDSMKLQIVFNRITFDDNYNVISAEACLLISLKNQLK